jgi:UDP-N-acetylglucosamine--N-acetylmuramyl-(pentapeptide) pyrophosphoryl-undecaprenol N-acetylglucosamine transferase
LLIPAPGTGLFFSSSGGHFSELLYIAKRFNAGLNSQIVTLNSSDTILTNLDFKVTYIPYVAPRKILPLIKLLPHLNSVAKQQKFDYIASTGAAIAVVAYIVAKIRRLPFFYIESIARHSSLSLTAKILQLLGGKRFFVQSTGLVNSNRTLIEHPIAKFSLYASGRMASPTSFNIFVALGTIRGFEFKRAINLVIPLLKESDSVIWQLGFTSYDNLPGRVVSQVDRLEFLSLIANADLVICHAGIGILTDCFEAGKCPIVIPRRREFEEHVDDHQVEILAYLQNRNIAINLEADQRRQLLDQAFSSRIVKI